MTSNKQFNPLNFQLTLAAGGLSLMPFNLLQFSLPHVGNLITLSDMGSKSLSPFQRIWAYPMVAIMLLLTVIHVSYTAKFLIRFAVWIKDNKDYKSLMDNPYQNERIFAFICSLSMTANVIWASFGFFVPQISNNIQVLMVPSLFYFLILWVLLMKWEMYVVKQWFVTPIEIERFNFTWLLDILAFGLVSLTGSGIASMSNNSVIASVAGFTSIFSISIGIILLVFKLIALFSSHIKKSSHPSVGLLPAYFLLIPLACLFGLSVFRMASFVGNLLNTNFKGLTFLVIVSSYVLAVSWGLFCIYLLKEYLTKNFIKSKFAPPQWAMI